MMTIYYSQTKGSDKEIPEYILDNDTRIPFNIRPPDEEDILEDYTPGENVKDVQGIYVNDTCIAYVLIFEDRSTQVFVENRRLASTMMIPRTQVEPQSIHNLRGRRTHINR